MRIILFCLLIVVLWPFFGQNLVFDSTFKRLGEFYEIPGLEMQWHRGMFSKSGVVANSENNEPCASFKFRVSSVKVDPNFIVSKLSQEMKIGEEFKIELTVKKDHFSAFSIREFQVYLGSSFNQNNSFLQGMFDLQMIRFSLDSLENNFITLTTTYTSQGGEEYIYLGSLDQSFNIAESAKYGLLLADKTYDMMPHNCTYHVQKISVGKIGESPSYKNQILRSNLYNLRVNNENLIINGGAEGDLAKRYYANDFLNGASGSLIAPFTYSLTDNVPRVSLLDSNDYRYTYEANGICYMGNGQFELDLLRTNIYHTYQEVVRRDEGQEYDTYYVYEKMSQTTQTSYLKGEYLVLSLGRELEKNQAYELSLMIKLKEFASYAVPHLGIHFVDEFPENVSDSLWQKMPEEVIDIEALSKSQAWHEYGLDYVAKGGEKFLILGHLPSLEGIIKNERFKPEISSSCGPNAYNCIDYYVYFKDSLYAGYQLDNVVLIEKEKSIGNLSSIYGQGKKVQLEVIYSEIRKSTDDEEKLERAKKVIMTGLEVLRVEDAMCVVDQRKNEPLILEPNPVLNKRKILRKLDNSRPVKKVKTNDLIPQNILFGEGIDNLHINHLVIVIDHQIMMSSAIEKISRFSQNGGQVTVFYVGENDKEESVKSLFTSIQGMQFLNFNEDVAIDEFAKILVTTD